MNDEILKDIKTNKNFYIKRRFNQEQLNLFFIEYSKIYHWVKDIDELIYCIIHNINHQPVCQFKNCHKFTIFNKNKKEYSLGCCKQHSQKISNLIKYGQENISQVTAIKEKKEKTMQERYGGIGNASDIIKNKMQQTVLEKYGVDNVMKNNDIKNKYQETIQQKYKVQNISQNNLIKEKRKETNLLRYGCDNVMFNEEIKNKHRKTIYTKYGVENIKLFKKPLWVNFKKVFQKQKFTIKSRKHTFELAKKLNVTFHRLMTFLRENDIFIEKEKGISYQENELKLFLSNFKFIKKSNFNNKKILYPLELDIYIPEKQLAIEYNGLYWHSNLYKDKYYHLNKTKLCEDKNIQLLHIFENEWMNEYQKEIWKNIIKQKLNMIQNKIYARKCFIQEIKDSSIKNEFLTHYHLQGKDKSTVKLGCYYENELVSIMTFCKSRYNKKYEWEISRYCVKSDYNIIGGASKLLKYFEKNYQPKSLITYADKRYSNGHLYKTLNFKELNDSKPNYFYFHKNNKMKLYSRINFQKHKLKKYYLNKQYHIKTFDETLTEKENMLNNNYLMIFDSGQKVFIKNY